MTTSITCRYAGSKAAACGAFDTEHHARAAAAGVCCVALAYGDVDQDHEDQGHDWPPFMPTDEDVPGGDW